MIQYGQYNVPTYNEMVNFGVGQPSTELLPLDIIKEGMDKVMEIDDPSLLQYGDIPGYLEFRKSLSRFLSSEYCKIVNPSELFTTNGVTQALTLLCSILTKSGDVILVEEPTYFLAINIFKDFKLNIVTIPMTNKGVDLMKLESELMKYPNQENLFFYTIPTFHNPMGVTTDHTHRLLLSELSDRYTNFKVIADEVYQLLYFDENKKPPLPLKYYNDNFISLGSFSKILAPSLRLGWIQASDKFINILKNSGQLDSSGGLNPFISSIVHNIIDKNLLKINIEKTREILKERCDILYESLNSNMSEYVDLEKPFGGYFLWIHLKNKLDANKLLKMSEEYQVKFHPGSKFSGNGDLKDCLRVSFSYYPREGMIVGAERLSKLIKDNMNHVERLKVSIIGANGKLGSLIRDLLKENNIDFLGNISRDYEIPDDTKMIIDVSSSEGTRMLLKKLQNSRIPLLIGTTGDLPIKELKLYSRFAPVAVISNFSEGIPLVLKWVNIANETLDNNWNINLEEKHHINKIDKPSGTAISINKELDSRAFINSVREGDNFGEHRISFENESEYLEIVHKAKKRNIFAEGAIKYIKWLSDMKPGFYTEMIQEKKTFLDDTIINFQKYSGCGNDFIMINTETDKIPSDLTSFVQTVCRRGSDVGADGVIFMTMNYEEIYDAKWVYYNSDGSMAKMCGNGLRCAAKYVYDNTCTNKDLKLITGDGLISIASLLKNGDIYASIPSPKILEIDDEIRRLIENILDKDLIQKTKELNNIYRIDVSVPHIVIILKSLNALNSLNVNNMGKIVNDLITDIDVNVNFVAFSDNKFYIRTFERGVFAETLACGTGCCSFAFVIHKFLKNNEIFINVKSGDTVRIFFKDNSIYLEGKANIIYKGVIDFKN